MSDRPAVVNPERIAKLIERERAAYAERHPVLAAGVRRGGREPARRRADDLDADVAGRVPALPGQRARGPADRHRRPRATSTSAWAIPARWPGTRPPPVRAAVARQYGELGGATTMLPTAGCRVGGGRAGAAVRARRTGASPSPPPTPTAGRSGWPASSPGGPRSWSSATATTAAWTSRSSSPARTARARARATWARRSIPARPRGSPSSTTCPAWSASWPRATWPRC